jgi:hypothetical protein
MRVPWSGLGVALVCLCGCWTTDSNNMKPPPPPPAYVLPPSDDPRFSAPPAFPQNTLNDGLKRPPQDPGQPGGAPGMPPSMRGAGASRFGAGPGGGY